MNQNQISVIISYNDVNGFTSGWHANRRLFICANDAGRGARTGEGETDVQRAGGVMHRLSGEFYRGSVPTENVGRYFIYAGRNAFEGAIRMALGLRERAPQVIIAVLACVCDWGEKQRMLQGMGIQLLRCECGGSDSLGLKARQISGLQT